MVLDFYKLKEQPFGATPDPDYLFLSPTHNKALESILYAIHNRRGFMSLIATPGMGKTTLLMQVLKQLEGAACTAFFFQTMCGPVDLLRGLLDDLGVRSQGESIAALQADLHSLLRAEAQKGRSVVVVIDEAQNLSDSCLEVVRMLSNFETTRDKLVQIVLAGQPSLQDQFASPALLQLRQRIAIHARLQPFNRDETRLYIDHRLQVAGCTNASLFAPEALDLISDRSQGIPRNINNICFTALKIGAGLKERMIQCEVIRDALKELDLSENDSDQVDERSGAPEVFAATTRLLNTSPAGFLWQPRFAAVVVLVLALALWVNARFEKLSAIHASPVGVASVPMGPGTSSTAETNGLANLDLRPVEEQAGSAESKPPIEPNLTAKATTAQEFATRSQGDNQHDEAASDDPATLWAQVKMSDSNAEVKLARMFLEGTGVDQNCAQAEILLLDASRKGNLQASSLLTDHSCR